MCLIVNNRYFLLIKLLFKKRTVNKRDVAQNYRCHASKCFPGLLMSHLQSIPA